MSREIVVSVNATSSGIVWRLKFSIDSKELRHYEEIAWKLQHF